MSKFLYPILIHVHIVFSAYYPPRFLPKVLKEKTESIFLLALNVCQNIVIESQQPLLYTVEFSAEPAFVHFIQALHDASIQTISVSDHRKLTSTVLADNRKNILFSLDKADEILDLIFHTISQEGTLMESEFIQSEFLNKPLPHYCVRIDGRPFQPHENLCSKFVNITSAELDGSSVLSSSLFDVTRGLYVNKIWNSRNHLIFLVKEFDHNYRKSAQRKPCQFEFGNKTFKNHEAGAPDGMILYFKFFWRFFKGRLAVICHPTGCEKYDPFTETLVSVTDGTFFDFSWNSMHGKPIRVVIDDDDNKNYYLKAAISFPERFAALYLVILEDFKQYMDGSAEYVTSENTNFDVEEGLKLDVSLYLFGSGVHLVEMDYSKVEFSAAIDSTAFCFITPHSGFMSQGLVIFKTFPTIVWCLVFGTVVCFLAMQYVFLHSQCGFFNRFYSEAEIDHLRDMSSILTIWAYFVCGRPPSPFFGRLVTGKVLFLIFSFSAFIISTIFLSEMTTLLSDRVLYPEIETLRELAESELFIQPINRISIESAQKILDQQSFEALKEKLISNLGFYLDEEYSGEIFTDYLTSSMRAGNDSIRKVWENIRAIAVTDACLVQIPALSMRKKNMFVTPLVNMEEVEYHLMEECLMTHPVMFLLLKNSFLFEKFNLFLMYYLESGFSKLNLENTADSYMRLESSRGMIVDVDQPRAYGLNDLQSAFVGLSLGLFFSFLVFVGELSLDYFQNSAIVKFFRGLKIPRVAFISRG